ncbi:MAG: hypothetical protein ACYCPP_03435 [Nitrososphaerales archaeon]
MRRKVFARRQSDNSRVKKPKARIIPNWNATKCKAKATINSTERTIALPEAGTSELSQ